MTVAPQGIAGGTSRLTHRLRGRRSGASRSAAPSTDRQN
jgi:hypothetical protein